MYLLSYLEPKQIGLSQAPEERPRTWGTEPCPWCSRNLRAAVHSLMKTLSPEGCTLPCHHRAAEGRLELAPASPPDVPPAAPPQGAGLGELGSLLSPGPRCTHMCQFKRYSADHRTQGCKILHQLAWQLQVELLTQTPPSLTFIGRKYRSFWSQNFCL